MHTNYAIKKGSNYAGRTSMHYMRYFPSVPFMKKECISLVRNSHPINSSINSHVHKSPTFQLNSGEWNIERTCFPIIVKMEF